MSARIAAAAPTPGRQQALLVWRAGASLTTVRDMSEEYGLARGWMHRYAAQARALAKDSPWRRQKIGLALTCRDRLTYLRAALAKAGQS